MYTPHPGLATLEMAAAGMLTVTNTFANKTPDVMARISSNLIVAEPTVESIAEALVEATARAGDIEARVAGSGFDWPRTWSGSFDERVLDVRRYGAAAPGVALTTASSTSPRAGYPSRLRARASFMRAVPSSVALRRRTAWGVTSTHSSSRRNSSA